MLTVLVDAASLPVPLGQLVWHCRAPEDGSDDALLTAYQRAAVAYAEKHCGLVFQPKELQVAFDGWPCGDIEIPAAPVRDVAKLEYLDESGTLQEVAGADWTWVRTAAGATVTFAAGFARPALADARRDRVRVTFSAGFDDPNATGGDPAYALPPQADLLVKMLVAHWYAQREPVTEDGGFDVPHGAKAMLAQLKVFR